MVLTLRVCRPVLYLSAVVDSYKHFYPGQVQFFSCYATYIATSALKLHLNIYEIKTFKVTSTSSSVAAGLHSKLLHTC